MRRFITLTAVAAALGLFALASETAPAQAATINVPDDFATIQEAVDAAVSGDQIRVGPGE